MPINATLQQQHQNKEYSSFKQAHVMSISLHIPTQISEISKTQQDSSITSSVSSSASSVLFTHSFCSSLDNANNNNNSTKINFIEFPDLSFHNIPVDKWQQENVKEWLESIGMQQIHVKNCLKFIKTGKVIFHLSWFFPVTSPNRPKIGYWGEEKTNI